MSEKGFHVYENMLWGILDDSSKIYILTLMIKNNFEGECTVTSHVKEDKTVIIVKDARGEVMILPVDILDILNN